MNKRFRKLLPSKMSQKKEVYVSIDGSEHVTEEAAHSESLKTMICFLCEWTIEDQNLDVLVDIVNEEKVMDLYAMMIEQADVVADNREVTIDEEEGEENGDI